MELSSRRRLTMRLQGAVAVEGEAVLWRPQPPRPRTSPAFPQPNGDAGDGSSQAYDSGPGQGAALRGRTSC